MLKQKEEEQSKKLEEAFERDRAHLKEKADKGSKYAEIEKEFEKDIVKRLVSAEEKYSSKIINKEA